MIMLMPTGNETRNPETNINRYLKLVREMMG